MLGILLPGVAAHALELASMQRLDDARRTPPADDAPGWRDTPLPDAVDGRPGGTPPGAYWYRARFDGPPAGEAAGSGGWALYLPYLYDGGQVWLNGAQVGEIAESVGRRRVRWERPHLLRLPPSLLRSDAPNRLEIRAAVSSARAVHRFPRI